MTLPLASRIALVTGASRGIGYATARALAKQGAHIVAVARTQGGLEELDDEIRKDGGSATLVPLSLTDFDGIARLGAALHERHGKLDILVGNAGVAGPSSPLGHIELKPWNDVMAVNVTANFQLVRCMEPLLKQSDAGRAVFLTSGAASQAPAYLGPYAASKAALEALVRVWAAETASTSLREAKAYAEVGGSYDDCHGIHTTHAWSVLEGVNIADMLTADRVVSRMAVYYRADDSGEASYDITGSYF